MLVTCAFRFIHNEHNESVDLDCLVLLEGRTGLCPAVLFLMDSVSMLFVVCGGEDDTVNTWTWREKEGPKMGARG